MQRKDNEMGTFLLRRIKDGIGPTVILGLVFFGLTALLGIPSGLTGSVLSHVPFYDVLPKAVADGVLILCNALFIAAVLAGVGALKHYGILFRLVSWMRPDNLLVLLFQRVFGGKEERFHYIIKLQWASTPILGVAVKKFVDWADGREKYTVFTSSAPNPATGPQPPQIDAERFITTEQCRAMIAERPDLVSVDDVVREGYVVIYSDLRAPDPRYTFLDFVVYQLSYGRYAVPGDSVDEKS